MGLPIPIYLSSSIYTYNLNKYIPVFVTGDEKLVDLVVKGDGSRFLLVGEYFSFVIQRFDFAKGGARYC